MLPDRLTSFDVHAGDRANCFIIEINADGTVKSDRVDIKDASPLAELPFLGGFLDFLIAERYEIIEDTIEVDLLFDKKL